MRILLVVRDHLFHSRALFRSRALFHSRALFLRNKTLFSEKIQRKKFPTELHSADIRGTGVLDIRGTRVLDIRGTGVLDIRGTGVYVR